MYSIISQLKFSEFKVSPTLNGKRVVFKKTIYKGIPIYSREQQNFTSERWYPYLIEYSLDMKIWNSELIDVVRILKKYV